MIYWSYLLSFGTLLLELGSEHPWYPWCTTSLRWGRCYTSPWIWPSPSMLWNPCSLPTQSSWYQCGPWIVGIMKWSRGWIYASQFLNTFPQQFVGWIWVYHVWNGTSSCFLAHTWCLEIIRVSGRIIFTITKNIAAPSSWELKLYDELKHLNLCFSSVIREFLIHGPSILDLRRCWVIIACFSE